MAGKYLPVVFRKFGKNGDVIALFPTVPATPNPYEMMSYMHVGQHGAASDDLASVTVAATPADYKDLLRELTNVVGYTNLVVYKRVTQQMHEERKVTLRAMREVQAKGERSR